MNSGEWVVRYRAWNSNRPEPKHLCHVIPAKAGIQRGGVSFRPKVWLWGVGLAALGPPPPDHVRGRL